MSHLIDTTNKVHKISFDFIQLTNRPVHENICIYVLNLLLFMENESKIRIRFCKTQIKERVSTFRSG